MKDYFFLLENFHQDDEVQSFLQELDSLLEGNSSSIHASLPNTYLDKHSFTKLQPIAHQILPIFPFTEDLICSSIKSMNVSSILLQHENTDNLHQHLSLFMEANFLIYCTVPHEKDLDTLKALYDPLLSKNYANMRPVIKISESFYLKQEELEEYILKINALFSQKPLLSISVLTHSQSIAKYQNHAYIHGLFFHDFSGFPTARKPRKS